MRILWILGSLAVLSACSSYSVHCNKHLRPINVPDRTAIAMPLPAATSPVSPKPPAVGGSGKP